jgi:ABC-type dipeptide/oligopeptide/nickel transport system permease subunit
MMRVVDVLYGLPYMFLVIILMVLFGRNIFNLFIALGAVEWLTMARIVRGQVLSLREREFVQAARATGGRPLRILAQHVVPNALGPIIVYATLTVPAAEQSTFGMSSLVLVHRVEEINAPPAAGAKASAPSARGSSFRASRSP